MNFRYFSGIFTCSILLFASGLAFFIFSLITHDAQDVQAYQKLIESENPNHVGKAAHSYKAKQQRRGLQKDVLFTQKNERLQLHLISADAELVLDHHEGKTEVIEYMNDVKCYMQEELFYLLPDGREAILQEDGRLLAKQGDSQDPLSWSSPDVEGVKPMQMIRFLEADAASYYYKNEMLEAKNVKISRYVTTGHQLSKEESGAHPLMSGVAEWVEFSMSGKELNFKAGQLKAKFYSSKRSLF